MLGCRTRPNQALDFFVGQFDPGTPGSLCEGFLVMEGFRPNMFLFYREMFFFLFFFPRTYSVCQSGVEVAVRAFIQHLGAFSMRCTLLQHLCHSQSGADHSDATVFPCFPKAKVAAEVAEEGAPPMNQHLNTEPCSDSWDLLM